MFQTSTTITAGYTATDAGSGVASYDVRYRSAAWNAPFTAYSYPTSWQHTTKTSVTVVGSAGRTYCVSVRARDHAGNVSGWTSDRCTALPLDDRSMTARGTWTRFSSGSSFGSTLSKTTVSGSYLSLAGSQAVHIALLVATCSTCGNVTIYSNGIALKTVSTKSTTTKYRVFLLTLAVAHRPATITIKSVSKGAPIYVDGLGVSRI
jgi:hypothetical protein